jgi:hypothetical protein
MTQPSTVWPAALRLDQAAEYSGLSVGTFKEVCPVRPLNMPARVTLYLRERLDDWNAEREDYVVILSRGAAPVSGKRGCVYIAGFGPYIKIGYTAGAVEDRVSDLQTGCPEEIKIYAIIPGSRSYEARLHRRFNHLRTRREWSRREGELADWIDGGFQ